MKLYSIAIELALFISDYFKFDKLSNTILSYRFDKFGVRYKSFDKRVNALKKLRKGYKLTTDELKFVSYSLEARPLSVVEKKRLYDQLFILSDDIKYKLTCNEISVLLLPYSGSRFAKSLSGLFEFLVSSNYVSSSVANYMYIKGNYLEAVVMFEQLEIVSMNYLKSLFYLDRFDLIEQLNLNRKNRKHKKKFERLCDYVSYELNKGLVSSDKAIKLFCSGVGISYKARKNLVNQILFDLGRYPTHIATMEKYCFKNKHAKMVISNYLISLAYVYSLSSARASAEEIIKQLYHDKSIRTLWYMSVAVSSLFDKKTLRELFDFEDCLDLMKNYANKDRSIYLYYICFGTMNEAIDNLDLRVSSGGNILRNDYIDTVEKKLYYTSVKNINYQFSLSSMFPTLEPGSYVVCESRFFNIFKKSFPELVFLPVVRPDIDSILHQFDWFGAEYQSLVMEERLNVYPISLEHSHINTIRKKEHGWLSIVHKDFSCLKEDRINVGISFGSGLQTGHRSIYNLPTEVEEYFDREKYNLIALDYNLSNEECGALNLNHPNIDLKCDINALLSLIRQLDVVICMPNSIVDAAASVGTKAVVFDPINRLSYWAHDDNKYIFSNNVTYLDFHVCEKIGIYDTDKLFLEISRLINEI